MNYEKEIERIIDKNFNKVNREGVGFLTTEMNKCKTELANLVKNLTIPVVINQRELLIDFCSSVECYQINTDQVELADGVDKYLKSINSL